MRVPLVIGNWKMHKTVAEARLLAKAIVLDLPANTGTEVVVCPPFTALAAVAEMLEDSPIELGAQNLFYEVQGAYTGEISPAFLVELGCSYAIVGHSERRRILGEGDEMVRRKVRAALDHGLVPILCVGETWEERKAGRTFARLREQLSTGIDQVRPEETVVIAYEPVWAIGTGQAATPEQADEAQRYLRGLCGERLGQDWATSVRIVYGGSVTAENIAALMAQPDIDGALVGGASLRPEFTRIAGFQVMR